MRERVSALGGELQIDSPKGQGTRLKVRIPVQAQRMAYEPVASTRQRDSTDLPAQEAGA